MTEHGSRLKEKLSTIIALTLQTINELLLECHLLINSTLNGRELLYVNASPFS